MCVVNLGGFSVQPRPTPHVCHGQLIGAQANSRSRVSPTLNTTYVATRQISRPLQQQTGTTWRSVSLAGGGDEVGRAASLPKRDYEDIPARVQGGCHHADAAVLLQYKNVDVGGTHWFPVLRVYELMRFTDRK